MSITARSTVQSWILQNRPDAPVFLFDPMAVSRSAQAFLGGFPGLVTYAVKANPNPAMIEALVAAGVETFDVASPAEMALVRSILPRAVLHYHNPVRSRSEIATARQFGVASWSVDRQTELAKLGDIAGQEIAVRFKLPVTGAVYDFGSKFGAEPAEAITLLRAVAAAGARPSLTFHPGTQCGAATVWVPYIEAAAEIARAAGVTLNRLNVGGGFPSSRDGRPAPWHDHFDAIRTAAQAAFDTVPPLVCEPGRALAAEALTLVARIKARDGDTLFLNDGIYGALSEWRDLGPLDRFAVLSPQGQLRRGAAQPFTVFGPTCDSLDRLPEPTVLPSDSVEEDFVVITGLGAYSTALNTAFNGYGTDTVIPLAAPAPSGHWFG